MFGNICCTTCLNFPPFDPFEGLLKCVDSQKRSQGTAGRGGHGLDWIGRINYNIIVWSSLILSKIMKEVEPNKTNLILFGSVGLDLSPVLFLLHFLNIVSQDFCRNIT